MEVLSNIYPIPEMEVEVVPLIERVTVVA